MNEDGTTIDREASTPYVMHGTPDAGTGTGTGSRVRRYIVDNFLYARPDLPFGDDDPLFGQGIIDSFGATELIAFLEDEFGIAIADDEVTEAHLGSVSAIAQFVASKRAAAQPGTPNS